MTDLVLVATVAVGLNVLLLAVLSTVWYSNWRQLGSKHALGLLIFGVLLLAENAFALYYYLIDPTLSAWFATSVPDVAWWAMLTFHVLETVAIAFLAWVTLD
jgi:hypothetical protein